MTVGWSSKLIAGTTVDQTMSINIELIEQTEKGKNLVSYIFLCPGVIVAPCNAFSPSSEDACAVPPSSPFGGVGGRVEEGTWGASGRATLDVDVEVDVDVANDWNSVAFLKASRQLIRERIFMSRTINQLIDEWMDGRLNEETNKPIIKQINK